MPAAHHFGNKATDFSGSVRLEVTQPSGFDNVMFADLPKFTFEFPLGIRMCRFAVHTRLAGNPLYLNLGHDGAYQVGQIPDLCF